MRTLNCFRSFAKYFYCGAFLTLIFTFEQRFLKQPGEFARDVYISAAYRLSSRHIRVIIVKKCNDDGGLSLTTEDDTGTNITIFARVTPYHEECPWKECTYEGFFADFRLRSNFHGDRITLSTGVERSASVAVRKAIPLNNPRHFLSICVAAMSYYENSAQLIRFIEYWKLVGTTKFVFYWQSITADIQHVVAFYRNSSAIDIEMVAWSRLPDAEVDKEFYYTGQLTSINDCLHRARGDAKFVAIVDLDEYIVPLDGSLVGILEEVNASTAGLLFYSRFANIRGNDDGVSIDPNDYNFSNWASILIDKNVNEYRSKVIVKPEMIRRGNIHFVEEFEGDARGTAVVPAEKAIVIHFKGYKQFVSSEYVTSKILATVAEKMAHQWRERIKAVSSSVINFKVTEGHRQVYESIDNCLSAILNWSNGTCFTASRCSVSQLFTNITVDWQWATESWTNL